MRNFNKGFAPILVIVLVAAGLALGGGALYYVSVVKKSAQVACTQEAKQCPDGSYVGRTGPNCEFAECPAASKISLITISPTRGKVGAKVMLTGTGFAVYGNTVRFGEGYIRNLDSLNGKSLSFTVPEGLDLCGPNSTICPGAFPAVRPGGYSISVLDIQGIESNSQIFTVHD